MRSLASALIVLLALAGPSLAEGVGFPSSAPQSLCRAAIRQVEGVSGGLLPDHLMAAIAHVESGRRDPQTGRFVPWPWTINAEGQGYFFETKAEAIAAVRDLQAKGVRSIDVGCMQINLMHHPNAFASLEQAFDPPANAAYGARFLVQLHDQSGDWRRATGLYHSATPNLAADYERQVEAALPAEEHEGSEGAFTQLASAWPRPFASSQPVSPGAIGAGFSRSSGSVSFLAAGNGPVLPSGGEKARIIPLAASPGGVAPGRGLDAYRAMPIALASRLVRSPGV